MINFDNTYIKLPSQFYQRIDPEAPYSPNLLAFNYELASELGLDLSEQSEDNLAKYFSGKRIPEGAEPIALAYAGHQFGHFVPQLGDGRAVLLGEVLTKKNKRFDIQLKGSGQTQFSRNGDGLSALGPVIREYIVSEAMYHLGVPTTRSLAAIATGENVMREELTPGGVLARVASSHIRVGTFQYFAAQADFANVKILADYTINRHYPHLNDEKNKYFLFWQEVCRRQLSLVAKWMSFGFIHGVMNTDNMTVSGETIDYGPCAFMDEFSFNKVFSSIDERGRYAYSQQGNIALWNFARLAETLIPLIKEKDKNIEEKFEEELNSFENKFGQGLQKLLLRKLGLNNETEHSKKLVMNWFDYLQTEQLDFTLSFRKLGELLEIEDIEGQDSFKVTDKFKNFFELWKGQLKTSPTDLKDVRKLMNKTNPLYIARNHQVERAIQGVQNNDLSIFKDLIQVLKRPFEEQIKFAKYQTPPAPEERVCKTFCGT